LGVKIALFEMNTHPCITPEAIIIAPRARDIDGALRVVSMAERELIGRV
jgi:hypothetical protein